MLHEQPFVELEPQALAQGLDTVPMRKRAPGEEKLRNQP